MHRACQQMSWFGCQSLIQNWKGKKLSDGKGLTGRGRPTSEAINTLQNYYGMSIRQNLDNIYAMKKSVFATLFHCTDIKDEDVRHQFCPRSETSWCLYQRDKLTGKKTYKKKLNLLVPIKNVLIPIWKDLADESLLRKCLHGQTQNVNESLNGMIWRRCPKQTFVSKATVQMAVNSAVINFNNGFTGLKSVFQEVGLRIGHYTAKGFKVKDQERIRIMNRKSTDKVKRRRMTLRKIRKGYIDKEKEQEPTPAYSKGAF